MPQVGIPARRAQSHVASTASSGMGRSAVALHARAQQRETAEDRIERVERAGAGDDQQVGALRPDAVSSSSTAAPRRSKAIGNRRPPNHSTFCFSAVSNRRAAWLERSCATAPIVVGLNPLTATIPRVAPDLLDGAERVGGDHDGVHLALGDGFAKARTGWPPKRLRSRSSSPFASVAPRA